MFYVMKTEIKMSAYIVNIFYYREFQYHTECGVSFGMLVLLRELSKKKMEYLQCHDIHYKSNDNPLGGSKVISGTNRHTRRHIISLAFLGMEIIINTA
jgi:hypothetical protein